MPIIFRNFAQDDSEMMPLSIFRNRAVCYSAILLTEVRKPETSRINRYLQHCRLIPIDERLLFQLSFANPVGVEGFASWFIDTFVGVRPEVIPLCLQQVGGQASLSVAIVVGEGGCEAGSG